MDVALALLIPVWFGLDQVFRTVGRAWRCLDLAICAFAELRGFLGGNHSIAHRLAAFMARLWFGSLLLLSCCDSMCCTVPD